MGRYVLLTSPRSPHEWLGPSHLPFRIRRRSSGLYLLAENVGSPVVVAERPSRESFARMLERERFNVVGIGFGAHQLSGARDLARLVRLLQPTAEILLGGPGASIPGVERLVDCDRVCSGDGVAALREVLGEDRAAPVRLPVLSGAARLSAAGHSELATLVAGFGSGEGRVRYFADGEALFAEACRLAEAMQTETFVVPDEGFLSDREVARGLLGAMKREGRELELAAFARVEDLCAWDPDELVALGVFGVAVSGPGEARAGQALAGLRERGIAVHLTTLLGESDGPEALEAALALEADETTVLPRLALEASPDSAALDRLLAACDGGAPVPLDERLKLARARVLERHGSPTMRLARTVLQGLRRAAASEDPWLQRRARRLRWRATDLRILLAGRAVAEESAADRTRWEELEREFAFTLGPDTLQQRAAALGSLAYQELGSMVRQVRKAAVGSLVRRYRWTEPIVAPRVVRTPGRRHG